MKRRKAFCQHWDKGSNMIRDITIGQYYQADSVIHRLDPRVKLMGTLIFVISLFLGSNIWLYLVVAAFLAIVIALSKIPLKFIVKGLKAIVILIVISAAFNLFLTPGTPLIKIWKLTITHEGLNTAVFMVIRLIAGDNGRGTSGGENVRTSGASDYRFLCADIDDNAHSADRCHRIYFEALQKSWCACA